MAAKLISNCVRHGSKMQIRQMSNIPPKHGNREVVCFGMNGEPTYLDISQVPMPAIRYKEVTPDIQVLKELEKGDWRKLSIEDKKALYRASFCQTFSEMDAPTGEWKSVTGFTALGIAISLWAYIWIKSISGLPLPESFNEENQIIQLKKMRELDLDPLENQIARIKRRQAKRQSKEEE